MLPHPPVDVEVQGDGPWLLDAMHTRPVAGLPPAPRMPDMSHRPLLALLALSLTLGLAACAPRAGNAPEAPPLPVTTSPVPENSMDESSCNADAARGAIGKTATAAVVEEARRAAGARIARTLKPGQMVTMEYHSSRLNIDVDERNVVTNVRCG
ncbi:hypothetical protein BH23PSE2_BH23PSE2_05250 [soil metagenome]